MEEQNPFLSTAQISSALGVRTVWPTDPWPPPRPKPPPFASDADHVYVASAEAGLGLDEVTEELVDGVVPGATGSNEPLRAS